MEKIRMYKPHSILIKEMVKIIRAARPRIMVDGGYWLIKYPVNSATSKNRMVEINDRTLHLYKGNFLCEINKNAGLSKGQ